MNGNIKSVARDRKLRGKGPRQSHSPIAISRRPVLFEWPCEIREISSDSLCVLCKTTLMSMHFIRSRQG